VTRRGGGERLVARSMTTGFVRGLRGLAPAWVVLASGIAAAQPPEGAVDEVPAVSPPALPEALRAPVRQPAEPFVGPVLADPGPPAGPAPGEPVLETDVAVEPEPEVPGAGAAVDAGAASPTVEEPAAPAAPDPPAQSPPDPSPASPPLVGGEPDLSLAAQAAVLLGGTLDPAAGPGARVALAGGAADLAQSLARAVFAAPVAGSIPYVVRAQVYHDVTLVFPADWTLVQVFVGDPRRWAVTHSGPLVVLKPGEAGARTNLTAVLASGEVLQMDLEEVTGLAGARRTGRVYVGPESWLVDRIFSLLPPDVRRRVAEAPVSVAQLLADPVAVVGLYGGTGAVPSPGGVVPLAAAAPAPPPAAVSRPPAASPALAAPVADPGGGAQPGRPSQPTAGAAPRGGAPRAGAPPSGEYVSGQELAALESRLREAQARVDTARRAAGDRIAAAQLGLEADLEALREEYPLRTQFSYVLDPPLPPYTEPFWHFGVWHDGDRTYWRVLAPDPDFRDADTGEPLAAERLDDFLYRFDRVVERGVLLVRLDNDPRVRELYFRRRRELEGP